MPCPMTLPHRNERYSSPVVVKGSPDGVPGLTNDATSDTSASQEPALVTTASEHAEPRIVRYNESQYRVVDSSILSHTGSWTGESDGKSWQQSHYDETHHISDLAEIAQALPKAKTRFHGPAAWQFEFLYKGRSLVAEDQSRRLSLDFTEIIKSKPTKSQKATAFTAESLVPGVLAGPDLSRSPDASSPANRSKPQYQPRPATGANVGKCARSRTSSEKLLCTSPQVPIDNAEIFEDLILRLWCALTDGTGYRYKAPANLGNQASSKSPNLPANQTTGEATGHDGTGKRKLRGRFERPEKDDEGGNSPPPKLAKKAAEPDLPFYACPVCEGNPQQAYETGCTAWGNVNIEEVLRHLELKHVASRHITKEAFEEVRAVWRNTKKAYRGPQLWKEVFNILYPAMEAPSPYRPTYEELQRNLAYQNFACRTREGFACEIEDNAVLRKYVEMCEGLVKQKKHLLFELWHSHKTSATKLDQEYDAKRRLLEDKFESGRSEIEDYYDKSMQEQRIRWALKVSDTVESSSAHLQAIGARSNATSSASDSFRTIHPTDIHLHHDSLSRGPSHPLQQNRLATMRDLREHRIIPTIARTDEVISTSTLSPTPALSRGEKSPFRDLTEQDSEDNFPPTPMGYPFLLGPQLSQSQPIGSQALRSFSHGSPPSEDFAFRDFCTSLGCKAIRGQDEALCYVHAYEAQQQREGTVLSHHDAMSMLDSPPPEL